jgi:hypothetical protein
MIDLSRLVGSRYREWEKLADANRKRGDEAFAVGNRVTARSNWLRAVNYHLAAIFPFGIANEDQRAATDGIRPYARDFVRYRNVPGEVVSIPWPDGVPR